MLARYFNQRTLAVLFLGFSSGLPLALVGSTLEAWFTTAGRSYIEIGWVTLVGVPYVLKFLWAPVLDRISVGFLGLRRGWILCMQLSLIALLFMMSMGSPAQDPVVLAFIALAVAFCSATQDVAIDAYRAEILSPAERGLGAAFSVCSYRVAMLVSSGLALILADHLGFATLYRLMAVCMLVGVATTVWMKEPAHPKDAHDSLGIKHFLWAPLKEFISRPQGWWLLLLVVLYKFGDAFIAKMTTAFLIRYLEFSLTQIGTVSKVAGLLATLAGALLGGFLMTRLTLYRALMIFGLCQAFSNLLFLWLAYMGHNFYAMALTILVENFCGGLGTAAFLAFLMGLCHPKYTAFQFALLSAIAVLPREFLGPLSGYLVENYGWMVYFTTTFVASFPGLICLWFLKNTVGKQIKSHTEYAEVLEASV